MSGLAPRAPEDSVRPRRLSDALVRLLNFTVRTRPERHHSVKKPSGFLLTVVIFAAAWSIYSRYGTHAPPHSPNLSAPQPEHAPPHPPGVSAPRPEPLESQSDPSDSERSPFRCDGRTYCSQMTSCAEAKYFLAHCPNVKMDGDHDGIPCERQWCRSG